MTEQIYLQHHGILGMKWGIRRFQNEDGTLTKAGKLRYRAEWALGTYDPKGNNPYVSDKRKRKRQQEIDEWNAAKEKRKAAKEKEQIRSNVRKELNKKAEQAGNEAADLRNKSNEKIAEQKQLKQEAAALKKHYVAGKIASRSAMTMLSSMAISMANDKFNSGKIDSGTVIRGFLLGMASVPVVAIQTGIEEGSAHREAEKKYGFRK